MNTPSMGRRSFVRGLPLAAAAAAIPVTVMGAVEHPNEKARRLAREMAATLRDPSFLGFRSVTVTPDGSQYWDADGEGTSSAPIDPLLVAIRNYRAGDAAFNAISEDEWPALGGEDAVIAKTWGPPLDVLFEWDRPAETLEGAIEALRLARDESAAFACVATIPNMIEAALAYFEAHPLAHDISDAALAYLTAEA